eukprot:scaffold23090_cov65-Phaeocystis_antarctica.AAC.2
MKRNDSAVLSNGPRHRDFRSGVNPDGNDNCLPPSSCPWRIFGVYSRACVRKARRRRATAGCSFCLHVLPPRALSASSSTCRGMSRARWGGEASPRLPRWPRHGPRSPSGRVPRASGEPPAELAATPLPVSVTPHIYVGPESRKGASHSPFPEFTHRALDNTKRAENS